MAKRRAAPNDPERPRAHVTSHLSLLLLLFLLLPLLQRINGRGCGAKSDRFRQRRGLRGAARGGGAAFLFFFLLLVLEFP